MQLTDPMLSTCLEMSWPIRQSGLPSIARGGGQGGDSRVIAKKWWGEEGETCAKGLVRIAKGYGGADLLRVCLLFYTWGSHHINSCARPSSTWRFWIGYLTDFPALKLLDLTAHATLIVQKGTESE